MTYASFRARGLPLGSGLLEADGKMPIEARLGRSGMASTRTGGQHILTIRTLVNSDRFDAVWFRHLELATAA